MKRRYYLYAALGLLLAVAGCTKEITMPTVVMDFDQTTYSATSGDATVVGRVTDDGGDLTDAGICYIKSTSGTPNVDDNKHSCGAKRDIKVELTGLTAGTYRVRAYAVNRVGTAYSEVGVMTITGPVTHPTVVWDYDNSGYNASQGTASLYATVTSNGNATVTAAGFCYIKGSSGTPTTSNSKWTSSNKTNLHAEVSGLDDGTYRIRPYATNNHGTGYGELVTMTIQRSGGGGTTTHTQNDILGTWSCQAYSPDQGQNFSWSGLTISYDNNSPTHPIDVKGLYRGYSYFHACGDWDQTNQCIRLKAGWAYSSRTFYFTSAPDTSFYVRFYPCYYNASTDNVNLLSKYSNGEDYEALLKYNNNGQLVLTYVTTPDQNGRTANAITWMLYYADTDESAGWYTVLSSMTLTKTSSKGGGLVEELPPPDPDGARPFRQR